MFEPVKSRSARGQTRGVRITCSRSHPDIVYISLDAPTMTLLNLDLPIVKETKKFPRIELLHDPAGKTFALTNAAPNGGVILYVQRHQGRITLERLEPEVISLLLGPERTTRIIAYPPPLEIQGRKALTVPYYESQPSPSLTIPTTTIPTLSLTFPA